MSDYLADPAVSASKLWSLHCSTPAHFLEELRAPASSSSSKDLGSLLHTLVFEPREFESRYVVLGQCEAILKSGERRGERCSSQGTIYRDGQSFCGTKGHDPYGKEIPTDASIVTTTAREKASAYEMKNALERDRELHEILSAEGSREVIGVWQDQETGLWLRIRPDMLIEEPSGTPERWHWSVPNLKSTGKVARGEPFRRDFENMGNHFKAAFYRMGIRELWPVEPQNFLYPTVETYPPYATILHRIHEDWLDATEAQVREALRLLADCLESDYWPAYARGVHDLNMSEWQQRQAASLQRIEFEEVVAV